MMGFEHAGLLYRVTVSIEHRIVVSVEEPYRVHMWMSGFAGHGPR